LEGGELLKCIFYGIIGRKEAGKEGKADEIKECIDCCERYGKIQAILS
jgi:hypothetical protein